MPSCDSCGETLRVGEPRAIIEVEPRGGLGAALDSYESVLCPSCVRQHQQVADVPHVLSPAAVDQMSAERRPADD